MPTLWLKVLNKHTHIIYIEMENVIQKKERKKYISTSVKHNYAKDAHTHARTHARMHAHTHTVQTDGSEGQCGLTEIF